MINPRNFLSFLKNLKIDSFFGVPDSVLKNFLSELSNDTQATNITCVNEGSAVSLAIGHYLGSRKIGLTYFQNSGLGNAINPLISIAHKNVYSIPQILLIGWRGSPNSKDEPQHISKGKITKSLLSKLNIKYELITREKDFSKVRNLINYSKKNLVPVAILVKNNTFTKISNQKKIEFKKSIPRSIFIEKLLKSLKKNDRIISTTGYTSRELHQIRNQKKNKLSKDFYMVGGMGHCSSVALGCSLKTKNKVVCLDGDGSMLMHLGSLSTISYYGKKNFKYIVLNNNSHESVGNQSTNSNNLNFNMLAYGFNFKSYDKIYKEKDIDKKIREFLNKKGPNFLEVRIKSKSLQNLGRPKNLKKIKNIFL